MKIIVDEKKGTFTIVPMTEAEETKISAVLSVLTPDQVLDYQGRSRDPENTKYVQAHFHIGGAKKKVRETKGNITFIGSKMEGGIELTLQGTSDDDKNEVGGIRDVCFFGAAGLIFIESTEVDGKKSMVVTAKKCKHCGANMISLSSCEWSTCSACAEKCEHVYVEGMVHGGGLDIGVGLFCEKCGRGKPKEPGEREKTVIEQHLDAEKKLGVHVVYKDGPPVNPEQAVQFNRMARGYAKSKARSAAKA